MSLCFLPIALVAVPYAFYRHVKLRGLRKFRDGEFDAYCGVCDNVEEIYYKTRRKIFYCTLDDDSHKTAYVSFIDTNVRSGDEVIILSTGTQDLIYRI